MTSRSITPPMRRRRTPRHFVLLALVALLLPIVGAGAPATAAVGPSGGVSALAPSGDMAAVSAELVRKVEDFNRQEAELARQAKDLVTEAEQITKDAAALRSATSKLNSETAAVRRKADAYNSRASALNAKISAHNSKPHRFQLPAQAAAANAYEAEANQLRAEQSQLRSMKSSLQSDQRRLGKQTSDLTSAQSRLTADRSAHDTKADTLRSREQQLQALGQQLLLQAARAVESLAANPPDPAATMDRGGDAAGPPQYRDQSQAQEAGIADSPSRQPQVTALQAYEKQTGTSVDMQPGTAYLTPEAVRQLPASQAAQLGSPSITYDGLVRKPNGNYRALRVRTSMASTNPGRKAFERALNKRGRLVTYKSNTKLLIDEFKLVPAPRSAPGPDDAPPRRDGKAHCLTHRPASARSSGGGWISNTRENVVLRNRTVDPGPPGSRATTAQACLTKPLVEGNEAAGDITGWQDAQAQAPDGNLARCHLIANVLGGRGLHVEDRPNLVPCWHLGMNIKGVSMRHYEIKVQRAVKELPKDAAVYYVVTPVYRTRPSTEPDSTIPRGVAVTAQVQMPDGTSWPVFNEVTLLNTPADGGPNLGN
ncbi:DNA/RNA non-specific endonuclease [Streptomyces sp. NPDC102364]|uniref:DNA/RNA non-specific endonuclease n=1 Tax=Streptomyces sp. NPDC102364 TaxID=3366161 RepID=UPI00380D5D19